LTGYCLAKYEKQIESWLSRHMSCFLLFLLFLFSFGITVLIQLYSYLELNGYALWYDLFTMPIVGLLLFLLLKTMGSTSFVQQRIEKNISICAFGIFLTHEPIVIILDRWLNIWNHNSLKVIVLFICSFSVSYGFVRLAALSPKTSALFLIKGQLSRKRKL